MRKIEFELSIEEMWDLGFAASVMSGMMPKNDTPEKERSGGKISCKLPVGDIEKIEELDDRAYKRFEEVMKMILASAYTFIRSSAMGGPKTYEILSNALFVGMYQDMIRKGVHPEKKKIMQDLLKDIGIEIHEVQDD